jgi:hypothetical protein
MSSREMHSARCWAARWEMESGLQTDWVVNDPLCEAQERGSAHGLFMIPTVCLLPHDPITVPSQIFWRRGVVEPERAFFARWIPAAARVWV